MTKLYCYCDEASFDSKDGLTLGTGVLLSTQPISQDPINWALKELRLDPDRNALDDRTIGRGYFHASEDSNCWFRRTNFERHPELFKPSS